MLEQAFALLLKIAEKILELKVPKLSIQYEPDGLTFVKNQLVAKKAEAEIGFKAVISLDEVYKVN